VSSPWLTDLNIACPLTEQTDVMKVGRTCSVDVTESHRRNFMRNALSMFEKCMRQTKTQNLEKKRDSLIRRKQLSIFKQLHDRRMR